MDYFWGPGLFWHVPMLPTIYVVILAVPTLLSLVRFHNNGNNVYFHITHIIKRLAACGQHKKK